MFKYFCLISFSIKFRSTAYAGLYMITFVGTDRFYIGSSLDIAQRERRHRHDFRSGTNTKALQAAYEAADGQWTLTTISQQFEDVLELRQAEAHLLEIMWGAPGRLNQRKTVDLAPQWEMDPSTVSGGSEDREAEWASRGSNYRGGAPK